MFLANLPDGNVRAVVTDFGLARSTSGEASAQTASGWGAGTPLYMAPEQLEGKPAGPAADIYAFGVVMYEMAVNAVPHQNESPLLIAVRRLKEKPQPPHLVNQNVDPRWEAAILRCLETKPEDRFANPEAIVAAIESRHFFSTVYPCQPNQAYWFARRGCCVNGLDWCIGFLSVVQACQSFA